MTGKFFDCVEKLPLLFKQLMESKEYDIEDLKEGKIKEILGQTSPVKGVYLMCDKDIPMYVGNSVTLAQKVGEDERSKDKSTTVKKILDSDDTISSLDEARSYLSQYYKVRFIRVEDDLLRTLLAIYAATELETPFNEF